MYAARSSIELPAPKRIYLLTSPSQRTNPPYHIDVRESMLHTRTIGRVEEVQCRRRTKSCSANTAKPGLVGRFNHPHRIDLSSQTRCQSRINPGTSAYPPGFGARAEVCCIRSSARLFSRSGKYQVARALQSGCTLPQSQTISEGIERHPSTPVTPLGQDQKG